MIPYTLHFLTGDCCEYWRSVGARKNLLISMMKDHEAEKRKIRSADKDKRTENLLEYSTVIPGHCDSLLQPIPSSANLIKEEPMIDDDSHSDLMIKTPKHFSLMEGHRVIRKNIESTENDINGENLEEVSMVTIGNLDSLPNQMPLFAVFPTEEPTFDEDSKVGLMIETEDIQSEIELTGDQEENTFTKIDIKVESDDSMSSSSYVS